MLLGLSSDFGAYLFDVFVTRLDWLLAFGLLAQGLFAARFLVQWIASERAGRSVIPVSFWFISLAGGLLTLIYGLFRRDAVIILGQLPSVVIYTRNLVLISRTKRRRELSAAASHARAGSGGGGGGGDGAARP